MIDLILLIAGCTFLAYIIESRTVNYGNTRMCIKNDLQSKLIYFIILITIILFAGLRTTYNDTAGYKKLFDVFVTYDFKFGDGSSYIGYDFLQKIIKIYISDNSQALIFIASIITGILNFSFIKKYSENFSGSVFLFLIGGYIFSMAGIKQAIANGIALYAISAYLNKKYIKSILLLLLAMSFHPYVVCLVCVPLLANKTWDVRMIITIAIATLAFMNLEFVFSLFGAIGKDYSTENHFTYTINPFRVIVEAIPIVISLIYKNKLNNSNDRLLALGINMKIISFAFIFFGLFMNPIYLGRMSSYFSILSVIVVPKMLKIVFPGKCNALAIGYYAIFFVYFFLDMTKIGTYSIFYDQFNHMNLLAFLKIIF